jgi:DNA repair exonuclease SbcCD ATPase subunit
MSDGPEIQVMTMEEAERQAAERGPANRYRVLETLHAGTDGEPCPGCGEPHEDETDFLIVSEAVTTFEIITGLAEPLAAATDQDGADLIVSALNRLAAN